MSDILVSGNEQLKFLQTNTFVQSVGNSFPEKNENFDNASSSFLPFISTIIDSGRNFLCNVDTNSEFCKFKIVISVGF